VDVHDRHVRTAGRQQLQRVGAGGGNAHVELARVDAGVHRVRLEIERQPAVRRALRVLAAAPGQGREYRKQGKESAHDGEQ
jgi:hypothetical protein